MAYINVLFQQKVGDKQEFLTYQHHSPIKEGSLITVPFRNRLKSGLVWSNTENKPDFKTLDILHILKDKPLLTSDQLKLIAWMSEYYLCPLHIILKLFIPKRIFENKEFKRLPKDKEQKFDTSSKKLNKEQEAAYQEISNSKENNFLIQGITGSGKTELYLQLTKEQIKNNKQVLILVPEIALTPQTINYFQSGLQQKATVINSKQSEGERYKAWENIWNNKSKLIIGSRSAIFAPFQDLGMIIIDEEHESSYKQDNSPRYCTKKIIEQIQKNNPKIKAIYGSATPSIESKYTKKVIFLHERIGKAELPEVELIDLRDEFKKKNFSIFSDRLREELINILAQKKQAILLLNRRGSASAIVCRDCGDKIICPDCEIPMTYHKSTISQPTLICHHCGKFGKIPNTCPNCKSQNIRQLGIGTQKIEEALKIEFPQARVLRADKDTTSTKNGFKNIYDAFRKHEADILVGTQMIAKGLDIAKVDLVGVILADIGLNIPDYKTSERSFQLITQVAGRAGRHSGQGKVLIQTYNPENIALQFARTHNFEDFYKYELTQRKLLRYPPFSQLAKILIENPYNNGCTRITKELEANLWKIAREQNIAKDIEINSYPAYITKLKNKYRQIVFIKDLNSKDLIHKLLEKLPKQYIMDPQIKIDIDPLNTT
ncbi:primosomal protein N' [Patescibacteria group bacterium]|nr:primosomal protein N' [Patescibacteria group bacterium]